VGTLTTQLDDHQKALLRIIARPWIVNDFDVEKGWPVWDFVQRRFTINNPEAPSAADVISSLPSVVVSGRTYSLWWRTNGLGAGPISPDERVGPSIAGLYHLQDLADGSRRPDLLECCLDVIRAAAEKERYLAEELEWHRVATDTLNLRTLFSANGAATAPIWHIGHILMREFIPIASETSANQFEVRYGHGRFQRFGKPVTAKSYLLVPESLARSSEAEARTPAPFDVPAVFDYMALVLERHPGWSAKEPVFSAPGFDQVTTMFSLPRNRDGFERRLSEFWNLLGRMNVPEPGQEDLEAHGWSKASLNSLQIWLENNFSDEVNTIQRCMETLRAVGRVRQGGQHSSSDKLHKRDVALRNLGIQPPVTHWAECWSSILQACAADLYELALLVRRGTNED
jgi:hypothetical protein